MFLTGGFDVFDRRFWWFWQVVLMVLTAGFDVLTVGFDVLTVGFDVLMILTGGFCFWRMYNKWQQVLMFLMILTVGFDGFDVLTAGFDVFDDFDSRFLCFWWYRQKVFVFWRLYFKSCYHDSRFCPLKTLLSGNSPPTHSCVSGSVLWKTVKASPTNICYFKTKVDCL